MIEALVDLPERGCGEAQPVKRARAHVLEQDVGLGHQVGEDLPTPGVFEIQRDRQFIPCGSQPEGLVPVFDHRPVADRVRDGGRLDLDHLGAVISQHGGGKRRGDDRAEVNNSDALEGGVRVRRLASLRSEEGCQVRTVHTGPVYCAFQFVFQSASAGKTLGPAPTTAGEANQSCTASFHLRKWGVVMWWSKAARSL